MIEEPVILRTSFLNASADFIEKYLGSEILIHKSENNLERFDHGTYGYNQLLKDLSNLNILVLENNIYNLVIENNELTNKQYVVLQYIQKYMPPWSIRFKRGLIHLRDIQEDYPKIHQCLEELGIFNKNLTDEASNFIYKVKELIYSQMNSSANIQIGKKGEKLSIEYEYKKSGIRPTYQALIDERSGFDLIAYGKNEEEKYIEVKASKRGQAHITWNEWKTAINKNENNETYEFHFWKLEEKYYELAILNSDDLNFLGSISEKGHHWETYLIEFKDFKKKFRKINKNMEYKI
tara:strand:+ start:8694 stop:9572 length:879 start_codon:yes stop_codon:yes gene_type:complete